MPWPKIGERPYPGSPKRQFSNPCLGLQDGWLGVGVGINLCQVKYCFFKIILQ